MSLITQLNKITDLPTLPSVVLQINDLLRSGESDAKQLAELIERDPALATKILKTVNSAYFTPVNQRIDSVQLAVARLGFNEVRNLALAVGVVRQFSREERVLNHRSFWRHCLQAGHIAQSVCVLRGDLDAEIMSTRYFLAGLLHDVGLLVYDQFFHEELRRIQQSASEHEETFLVAEERTAHRDAHPALGGALLELWKMPRQVVSAVRYHHSPQNSPECDHPIVWAVHLAECLLCSGRRATFEGSIEADLEQICRGNGITQDEALQLVAKLDSSVARYDSFLGMGGALR